jgi:aldehyde dehydrogenase (NAD+)
MTARGVRDEALAILARLGVTDDAFARDGLAAVSPITGETVATVRAAGPKEVGDAIGRRGAASSCGSSARSCARRRTISVVS